MNITKRLMLKAVLFVVLATIQQMSATTYYVATTGSDSNACSQASPCATINNAVNKHAQPGDTVIVENGTYAQTVAITAAGTSGNQITIESQTQYGAVIAPTAAQVSSNAGYIWQVQSGNGYITINGFEIDGSASSGTANQGIAAFNTSSNIVVENNKIHDWGESGCGGGAGINLHSTASTVDANLLYSYGNGGSGCIEWDGIYIGDGTNTVVTNNIVGETNSLTTGIQLNGEQATFSTFPSNITVTNNTIFSGNGIGILEACWNVPAAHNCSNNITNNNIIVNITASGGDQWPVRTADNGGTFDSSNQYSNNLVYNAGGASMASAQSLVNTVTSNPDFADFTGSQTGNYQLIAGSPAIGAGTATGAPNHDFAGNPRPSPDGLYDIGAYEFSSGTAPVTPPSAPNPPTGLSATVN
jgi:hypothetical protein